jgi:hypothetical protein
VEALALTPGQRERIRTIEEELLFGQMRETHSGKVAEGSGRPSLERIPRGHPMRRRVLALPTVLICSAIVLAGPAVMASGSADDGDSKGPAAGASLFGLTRVVDLHIEVAAEEYQAMQPPAPAVTLVWSGLIQGETVKE